jgi:L-lactate utilization protein LutC
VVIEGFTAAAAANACVVHGPLRPAEAAEQVVGVVLGHAHGGNVAVAHDALLEELDVGPWPARGGARLLRPDEPQWAERLPDAAVGVTGSVAAVAATGTVALAASPGSPRATSLLPPVHVCLVRVGDVVAEFADAVVRLGAGALPSALIWVGGPSRTSDLEMKPTLGVHGPKVVEVMLVSSM